MAGEILRDFARLIGNLFGCPCERRSFRQDYDHEQEHDDETSP